MAILDRRLFTGSLLACAGIGSACGMATQPAEMPLIARPDLYLCEGCEAVVEHVAPLSPIAHLARSDRGEPLRLEGVVRGPDGSAYAPGVILYAHQTNAEGLYANGNPRTEWSQRHGRLRGWVMTDAQGRYAFETIKPGVYPSRDGPAHIHLFVGEPGRRPYYIDDVVFDGEFGVDDSYRARADNRGGSGIVRLEQGSDGRLLARRDIRLEVRPS